MNTSYLKLSVVGVLLVSAIALSGQVVENLDKESVMVIQSVSGDLTAYTTPGPKGQWFGTATVMPRLATFPIEQKVRFNDGAHATLKGSIQYEVPTDPKQLESLVTKFGSADAISNQLIGTVVTKAVYMTGPLMSSKESYAEKRNLLINFVEDQVQHGVYQTTQKDVKIKDPYTGQEKSSTVVEIVLDEHGTPRRQEESVLTGYGVRTSNFTIATLDYEDAVENQIKEQQKLTMAVQTAMANSKKAEQDAITAEQSGKASAAKAKWDQEVIKAKFVTEAEQRLEVATLDAKAEEQKKRGTILQGEGEAAKQRLIREANGNLDQKLEAWKFSQKVWADAFSNYKGAIVPSVMMGQSDAAGSAGHFTTMMDLLAIKAAKDLSVDMQPAK